MIATYTLHDYKNCGDIQGQGHYVTINEKLLVLEFKSFHSRFISLRLVPMTVVKCPLINTKKNIKEKLLPQLTKDRCNIDVKKSLFYCNEREEQRILEG